MAEEHRDNGGHALIIYDDLTNKPKRTANCLCCFAAHRDVRHILGTFFISTAGFWKGPPK